MNVRNGHRAMHVLSAILAIILLAVVVSCSNASGCSAGQEPVNGICKPLCPDGYTRSLDGNCYLVPVGSDGDVSDGDTTDGDTSDGDVGDGDGTDGDVTDGDYQPKTAERIGALAGNFVGAEWDGTRMYVANTSGGMTIYDVSQPDAPTPIGRYMADASVVAVGLDAERHLAAVGLADERIQFVDVSDQEHPEWVSEFDLDLAIQWMAVLGNRVYVIVGRYSMDDGKLSVIDFSDATSPTVTYQHALPSETFTAAISENYLATVNANDEISLFSLSDPSKPSFLATIDPSGEGVGVNVSTLAIEGSSMLLLGNSYALWVDVSDPQNPVFGDEQAIKLTKPRRVVTAAGKYFIMNNTGYDPPTGELGIVDFDEQKRLMVDEKVSLRGEGLAVAARGEYAAIMMGQAGWMIASLGPDSLLSTVVDINAINSTSGFAFDNDVLYVCNRGSVDVIDVSDPYWPMHISSWSVENSAYNDYCRSPVISNGKLFVVNSEGSLVVMDISDPQAIQELGRAETDYTLWSAASLDHYVFASDTRKDKIVVFDVSDPTNPSELTAINEFEEAKLFVNAGYLLVLERRGELSILDVSDPFQPEKVYYNETILQNAVDISFDGNHAIVGRKKEPLIFLDMSDPTRPKKTAAAHMNNELTQVAMSGDSLAAFCGQAICFYDISTSESPIQIGRFALSSDGDGELFYRESAIILSRQEDGIQLYKINASTDQ